MNNTEKKYIILQLKNLNFIDVGATIYDSISSNNIVGCNAFSSSILRKRHTIERVAKYIKDNDLPLRIESGSPFINQFKIYFV